MFKVESDGSVVKAPGLVRREDHKHLPEKKSKKHGSHKHPGHHSLKQPSPEGHLAPSAPSLLQLAVITRCDKQFVMMAEGERNCTGSVVNPATEVISPEDCILAASRFGPTITKAAAADFTLTNHAIAFQPHPKGCFLKTGTKKV